MPFDFHPDAVQGVQLAFDFDAAPVCVAPFAPKAPRRQTNYHAGLTAEGLVERYYARRGARLLHSRWRGPGGEIDLILGEGDRVVFVEVKKSKTHARAVQRVSARQMQRIQASAEAYLDRCPKGSLTEVRIDVALVDGQGVVRTIENAPLAA
ncbi:YraN family protein [Marivita hallyeonensis]|uniref:UPF0102 protein SAMN05443551_0363 n=1 Tax=Marivita hallyeonensis TaxID=996342 RepID=A0A1M5M1Z2_9RHOB|nr:YraN family protein [Marivita hallyeonensis]SHG71210.1 putative endonuclease [Marivita hallyeonensis]